MGPLLFHSFVDSCPLRTPHAGCHRGRVVSQRMVLAEAFLAKNKLHVKDAYLVGGFAYCTGLNQTCWSRCALFGKPPSSCQFVVGRDMAGYENRSRLNKQKCKPIWGIKTPLFPAMACFCFMSDCQICQGQNVFYWIRLIRLDFLSNLWKVYFVKCQ